MMFEKFPEDARRDYHKNNIHSKGFESFTQSSMIADKPGGFYGKSQHLQYGKVSSQLNK